MVHRELELLLPSPLAHYEGTALPGEVSLTLNKFQVVEEGSHPWVEGRAGAGE